MYVYNIGNYDGTNPEEAETFQDRFNRTNIWERGEGEFSAQTIGTGSNAEGAYSIAAGYFAYAYGSRQGAVALGYYTTAYDRGSFAEGWLTYALKGGSHAEGQMTYALGQASHVEGRRTYAYMVGAHAEGVDTIAYGQSSHAEGGNTIAHGQSSHVEGEYTYAYGIVSHAEGGNTIAYGNCSHAEGQYTYAYGNSSHAEGAVSYAIGTVSHAENHKTYAYGGGSHAEGFSTISYGFISHAEGGNFAFSISLSGSNDANIYTGTQLKSHFDLLSNGRIDLQTQKEIIKKSFIISDNLIPIPVKIIDCEITENNEELLFTITTEKPLTSDNLIEHDTLISAAISIGDYSHSEGRSISYGNISHSEGTGTLSFGTNSHAEGETTYAGGTASHAEGINTNANGDYSHAEGLGSYTNASYSHSEGSFTQAHGLSSHTEGSFTYTGLNPDTMLNIVATNFSGANNMTLGLDGEFGSYSHAEGFLTFAYGQSSHSEGVMTRTTGAASHVEGWLTEASNRGAHAEGSWTSAYGEDSHAEGSETIAFGDSSHVEGLGSYTHADNSHAEGSGTHTLGVSSHAEGLSTYTYNTSEHAQGQFNKAHKVSNNFGDSYNSIHTIGIGTDDDNRKNAVTIMQNGDMYLYGVADYDGTNPEEATSLQQYFEETEYVISQALNDLHDNINSHELNIPQLPEQGDERFAYLLTGVSTEDGVSLSHTISYQVTGIPTKKYIDELIEANDALRYCGTVTVSAEENGAFTLTHNPSAAPGHGEVTPDTTRGAVYKVTNIGFFGTQRVSPGDMIISYTDTTTASSFEGWDVINENIDLRQLNRSALNGKAVITNVSLTADGTFSYTYSNLAVSNSGTLSMDGFAIAPGGPDSRHVNISGFSSDDNVLDVDDAGGEPAQVISRGVKVLTNVSLSQTNLTTKLTYSYSYIYADTSHHRTRTGFKNGDIALSLEGVNVITGAYLTYKGTFAYSYSRIYVADSEHANEADTLTAIDAVELNSYTHSVGNIYIDPTTNHVTYSYINLSGNTGTYIAGIIPAQNDRLHKVITGITQRGDGKITYSYSYIDTESIWERSTGSLSAIIKGADATASGWLSVAEGTNTYAGNIALSGIRGVEDGNKGDFTHAEGNGSWAIGMSAHAEGEQTTAYGLASHAEGGDTMAYGDYSHAEGINTYARNVGSHSEGEGTYAVGLWAHAEGYYTYAYDWACHAEGFGTKAIGPCSHAEGGLPEDMQLESVEDTPTTAYGISSHAEGLSTMAYGDYSHTEGELSYSVGMHSHAEGLYTYTYNDAEHAEGKYNKSTPGLTIHSIGIGIDHDNRKNAFEITNTGAAYLFGVGNYSGDNINSAKSLQQYFQDTEYVISSAINDLNDRVNTNEDVMYNSLFSKFEIANNTISAKIGNVEKSISVTYTPYSYALSSYTYFWGQPFNGTTNVEGNMINIGYAYTSGNIVITKAAYNQEFNGVDITTNKGYGIKFGIGTAGINRGLLDANTNKWILYTNGTGDVNSSYIIMPEYNVRIGSATNPGVELDVTGDIRASGKLYVGTSGSTKNAFITSDSANNIYVSINSKTSLVIEDNDIRRGSSNTTATLGTSNYRWANTYSVLGNFSGQITSTLANGTAPFSITSSTLNANLNADLLDNEHSYQIRAYSYTESDILFTTLPFIQEKKNFTTKLPITESPSPADAPYGYCFGPFTDYTTFYSRYISVSPGDKLACDMWIYREESEETPSKTFYIGLERFDRNMKPISSNNGCVYSGASNSSVPRDGQWHKFTGKWNIPESHTPYPTSDPVSDGGGVYWVRLRILLNYNGTGGTESWLGGIRLYRQNSLSTSPALTDSHNFRVSDNTATHQGAQVAFNGTQDVELKLPSYITVSIDGSSTTSYQTKTKELSTGAAYFTFVDSNNTNATDEYLYTTGNIYGTAAGAFTATGLGTFNRVKISNTNAVKHIEFSRGGVNYITAPSSGSIAFATNGKAATAAGTDVIIEDALLAPGNSSVGLGSNDKRWGSLFTNTANLSGQLTSTVAGGHTNHADPNNPVAPAVAGNSPFVITSSKKNDNLNADLLDDYHANELLEKFDVTLDGDKLNIVIKVGGKEITRSVDIWGDLSNTGVLNAPRVPVTVNGTLNQQS